MQKKIIIGLAAVAIIAAAAVYLTFVGTGKKPETVYETKSSEEQKAAIYSEYHTIYRSLFPEDADKAVDRTMYGLFYLKEKYPSVTFDVVTCEKVEQLYGSFTFGIKTMHGSEKYTLKAETTDAEGSYVFSDDFYKDFLKTPYEEKLKEKLSSIKGLSCIGVEVDFTEFTGFDKCREGTTADELFEDLSIDNNTTLYLSTDDAEKGEQLSFALEDALQKSGANGRFVYYIFADYKDDQWVDLKDYAEANLFTNCVVNGELNIGYGKGK